MTIENPKDRIGKAKPTFATLPIPPVSEVATVLLLGARKYGRHNWRGAGVVASVYYDAALRHLTAWWEGEDKDPESGISHLSHAVAGLLIARDAEMRGMISDDRPPPSPDFLSHVAERTSAILAALPDAPKPVTHKDVPPRECADDA